MFRFLNHFLEAQDCRGGRIQDAHNGTDGIGWVKVYKNSARFDKARNLLVAHKNFWHVLLVWMDNTRFDKGHIALGG